MLLPDWGGGTLYKNLPTASVYDTAGSRGSLVFSATAIGINIKTYQAQCYQKQFFHKGILFRINTISEVSEKFSDDLQYGDR